jgi:hypothetical protein
MDAFYGAFSPACFGLLGLWLVVVQLRLPQWQASADYALYKKGSYGIALHFALPGVMSVIALINSGNSAYWQVSFAIIALGGAIVLVSIRAMAGRGEPGAASAPRFPAGGELGLYAYVAAIVLYFLAGVLAFVGGLAVLRVEGILLTALVFLGFNAAWLLLFDDAPDAPGAATVIAAGPGGAPGQAAAGAGGAPDNVDVPPEGLGG